MHFLSSSAHRGKVKGFDTTGPEAEAELELEGCWWEGPGEETGRL